MSFATASIAMMGAGAAGSIVGSYFSAQSKKSLLNGQADIADINARIAELGAVSELARGRAQTNAIGLQHGQLKGRQRTALAANGVDLGEGSAAEVQTSGDMMSEIDRNTAEANAIRSAWGYRAQETDLQNDALLKRANASGISPAMASVSTLLSEGGTVAESWYRMSKTGAFNTPSNGSSGGSGLSLSSGGETGINPSGGRVGFKGMQW
jgi:hypothetical protein